MACFQANRTLRHRRTHEQQQNGEVVDSFSEEDLDNEDHHLVSVEEESPESEHAYLSNMPATTADLTAAAMTSMSTGGNVNGASMNGTSMAPPQMLIAHNY